MSSCQDLSMNCTRSTWSVQWKETTSSLRRRRSQRTRSSCQCSVASLLSSSNSFLMPSTTVDSNMSAASSLLIDKVDNSCVGRIHFFRLHLHPFPSTKLIAYHMLCPSPEFYFNFWFKMSRFLLKILLCSGK